MFDVGTESADSGFSTFSSGSVLGPSCWTPSQWPRASAADIGKSGISGPTPCGRSDIFGSLKQAVLPCGSFDTYHQLTASKQAADHTGSQHTTPAQNASSARQLLHGIQAQNQAAMVQVKQTLHSHTRYWPIQRPQRASPSQHWNCLEESNADVAVDVECCGDSGAASKICSVAPGSSALFSRSCTADVSAPSHSPPTFPPSLPTPCVSVRTTPNATHRIQVGSFSADFGS